MNLKGNKMNDITVPDDAKYNHEFSYYKFGRHGLLYVWRDSGWKNFNPMDDNFIKTIRFHNLRKMSQGEVTRHLLSCGWINTDTIKDKVRIWRRPEKEYIDYEILEPLKTKFKDYNNRLKDMAYTLEDFEADQRSKK